MFMYNWRSYAAVPGALFPGPAHWPPMQSTFELKLTTLVHSQEEELAAGVA